MTLRPVFLLFMVLSLAGALFLWSRDMPRAKAVFDPSNKFIQISAAAGAYSPKGKKVVRLVTKTGAEYFTDCLAMNFVCDEAAGIRLPVEVTAYRLSSRLIWPISASINARTVLTPESSQLLYELYAEREGASYRFPLALAAAFAVFSIWFGKRPAFS